MGIVRQIASAYTGIPIPGGKRSSLMDSSSSDSPNSTDDTGVGSDYGEKYGTATQRAVKRAMKRAGNGKRSDNGY